MANFWNFIVQTNTFNFAILIVIFVAIFQKINFISLIEKIREEISKAIEDAKILRETSENELKSAYKQAKTTESEIQAKFTAAKKSAEDLSDEIVRNKNLQIQNINKNILRILSAEEKKISVGLAAETVKSSIELARQKIIGNLKDSPELHDKLIKESISEL